MEDKKPVVSSSQASDATKSKKFSPEKVKNIIDVKQKMLNSNIVNK